MTSEDTIQEGIRAAARAAKGNKREIPTQITLSNGIVLGVRPMPPMLLNSVSNSIPEPEVPVVYIEEKGRDEPNPNHPAYLRAVQERTTAVAIATINLILYACTYPISVPEGMSRHTDDDWISILKLAGLEMDANDPVQRYIQWLRCYAVATMEDMTDIQTVPLQLAGITEVEVGEVVDSFRSGEGSDTDNGVSGELGNQNGHNVQTLDSRTRTRSRRT